MQIFRRRPMFLACTAFMGMSVILYCFKFYNIALYIGVVFAVLAVFILILSIVKKRKKILLISIVSIALSLASFESFWYFGVEYEKMSSYHGTEQCFEAVVLSENYSYSYMSSYNVGLVSVSKPMIFWARRYVMARLNSAPTASITIILPGNDAYSSASSSFGVILSLNIANF